MSQHGDIRSPKIHKPTRFGPGALVARSPKKALARSGVRTISIHCAKCRYLLYKYHKGGTGGLVKCRPERIVEDRTKGDLHCPECRQEFARLRTIGGKPAHKIIQGKVFTRGMRRK